MVRSLLRLLFGGDRRPRRTRPSAIDRRHGPPPLMTSVGISVRSRPERAIAEFLHARGVRYVYEHRMRLRGFRGGRTYRTPDFLLSEHGVVWEHFGLWGDPEYERSARRTMALYHHNGVRFVCTFGGPPTRHKLERVLQEAQELGRRQRR